MQTSCFKVFQIQTSQVRHAALSGKQWLHETVGNW